MNAATEMTDDRCLHDLGQLTEVLATLGCRSLFLVADPVAYVASGAAGRLTPVFTGHRVTLFQDFDPNPKLEHLAEGLQRFRAQPGDVVLAIGGGTAIDLAKLIAWAAPRNEPLRDLVRGSGLAAQSALPLIAVPTTAGTGSEATQFAVLYVDGQKQSIDAPELMPKFCVLDARLTATLPAPITAHTGLDALCQGIESLWSVHATERSIGYAADAISLAWHSLADAVQRPTESTRAAMLRASHLAGRAINLTRTTASHAISYALTSDYGIPHGHAVALTIGPMLVHNAGVTPADNQDPRGVERVRGRITQILQLLGCEDAFTARARIADLLDAIGCERHPSRLGVVGREAIETIAGKVNVQRLGNNPRRLTHEQLVTMLESLG